MGVPTMSMVSLALVCIFAGAMSAPAPTSPFLSAAAFQSEFAGFQLKFARNYSTSQQAHRFEVFSQNLAAIYAHNVHNVISTGVTVGVNQFTDLTQEEFRATILMDLASLTKNDNTSVAAVTDMACACQSYVPVTIAGQSHYCVVPSAPSVCFRYYGPAPCTNYGSPLLPCTAGPPSPPGPPTPTPTPTPVPPPPPTPPGPAVSSIDWVDKGAVTPVKDQQRCGSCWAFSATGALEGAVFVATGILESLSEQSLTSCDDQLFHCDGGTPHAALQWIQDKRGIALESEYPYDSQTAAGTVTACDPVKESVMAPYTKSITAITDVNSNDENALEAALSKQPIAVMIEADQSMFSSYQSGVLKASAGCGTKLDHAVLAVGFGTDPDGTKYWRVKNSWGTTWGDQGYIKLERTGSMGPGTCGIASSPSYATVSL